MSNTVKIPTSFDIQVYSDTNKITNLISQARVRIFYKGLNRNGTYISEEIAKQLIYSLPYVPIKGIFDIIDEDFTDHGKTRQEGRAYGVVPSFEAMEFAWEEHEDEDGETREYACCNVYLWTGLYEEAEKVINSSQSMELNPETITGDWVRENNVKHYEYSFAEFLGLQALGTDVEPCFEGSAFFTKTEISDLEKIFCELKEAHNFVNQKSKDLNNNNKNHEKGGNVMKFKLSHEDIYSKISTALNTNVDEEGYRIYEYGIGPVYDNYAIATSYTDGNVYRIHYTVTNSELTVGEKERVFIVDVSESEYSALQAVKVLNGDTYDKLNDNFQTANDTVVDLTGKFEAAEKTIETMTTTETGLNDRIVELETQYTTKEGEVEILSTELEGLKEFKLAQETAEKTAIIDKFAQVLDEETIQPFKDGMETYQVVELEKELSVLYVKNQEKASQFNYVSTGNPALSGVEALIAKHQKEEK